MSKHWNPNEDLADRSCPQHDLDRELARCIAAKELAQTQKRAWPPGATAGLVLVATCCLALGLILYQVAGPRDVVAESVAP